jgi:putative oxidoreductase
MDMGLLLARVTLGLLMAAHGSQKLFGWFGGYGLTATAGFFDSLGFRPGRLMATVASVLEITSGLLLVLGLLTPVGAALMVSVMIVAASVHWPNGLFATANGIEVNLLYGVSAAAIALIGPGAYSLDALFHLTAFYTPVFVWSALGLGVLGGLVNIGLRRQAPQPVTA